MAEDAATWPTRRGRTPPCAPPPCGTPSATLVTRRSGELGRPLRVVDLGGGTGGLAVPLAELGHHVTVVDPSPDALAALTRRAGDAGVADRVVAVQGDAATLLEVAPRAPTPTWSAATAPSRSSTTPPRRMRAVAAVLADGGYVSLLVAQRLAVVLARALSGHFAQARHALTSDDGRWGAGRPAAAPVRRGR